MLWVDVRERVIGALGLTRGKEGTTKVWRYDKIARDADKCWRSTCRYVETEVPEVRRNSEGECRVWLCTSRRCKSGSW